MMDLKFKRVILFSSDPERLSAFYRDVLGLAEVGREKGWIEFDAGGCAIALHKGRSVAGTRPPKLVFHARDVSAARARLIKRGFARLGPVKSAPSFQMCDGRDPDGNPIQISSRA
jgi:catechol 2,3-dioxygenase-like lactoylglutathione lyase family enzyme